MCKVTYDTIVLAIIGFSPFLISFIYPVKSKENVTEGRRFSQQIMLPGWPLLSSGWRTQQGQVDILAVGKRVSAGQGEKLVKQGVDGEAELGRIGAVAQGSQPGTAGRVKDTGTA